jgi:hypothetical protein
MNGYFSEKPFADGLKQMVLEAKFLFVHFYSFFEKKYNNPHGGNPLAKILAVRKKMRTSMST